jgi:hypothetical protein
MEDLTLDRAKTAVLCMDIQKNTVRISAIYRERNVGQAARSRLGRPASSLFTSSLTISRLFTR